MNKPKILAYYLPQFHEIPENNEWWGCGFTEWNALENAKIYKPIQYVRKPIGPYFNYNLPSKDVMEWQAEVANKHNIYGFLIWDYWFGNRKKLLEKPKEYIVENNIHFPYSLIWANHSWYNKRKKKLLIKQQYLGVKDYEQYFSDCLKHFLNDNYIKINNKPVFGIYMPFDIPDLDCFMELFDNNARLNGFNGIYWVVDNTPATHLNKDKFDCIVSSTIYFKARKFRHPVNFIKEQLIKKFNMNDIGPVVYSYKKLVSTHKNFSRNETPVIFTGWDTTPRHMERGTILKDFNVSAFEQHLDNVFNFSKYANSELLILKSWNEWAEGNLLEPDDVFGYTLLEALQKKYNKYFTQG